MKTSLYLSLVLFGVATKLSTAFQQQQQTPQQLSSSYHHHQRIPNYHSAPQNRVTVDGCRSRRTRQSGLFPRGFNGNGVVFRSSSSSSLSTTSLQSAALTTAVAALDTFWKTSPYAAAAIVCGVKASLADYLAQKRQNRKAEEAAVAATEDESDAAVALNGGAAALSVPKAKTNKMRNLAYLVYGSLYQGMFQEYMYNHLYPVLFGTGTNLTTVLSKVCFDLFIQTILLTLPIAYLSKALIFRYSVKEAFRRYTDDIRNHGLLTKYFTLWGPVQCITFSIIPEHFRVTFIAIFSFFWLIILSSIASKPRVAVSETGETTHLPDDCPMEDGQTCELEFNERS